MVNVNTVYRTVQALSNKEQRGYLTPTEFNLYAEQAQLEIFESYFFDDAHFSLNRKGMAATGASNIKKLIQEKIDIFSRTGDATYSSTNSNFALPTDLYRLGAVYFTDTTGTKQVPMIMHEQLHYVLSSALTAPSTVFPKFTRSAQTITMYPNTIQTGVTVHYIKTPSQPKWNYTQLGTDREPVYNVTGTTHFELHPSELYTLIDKILMYTGIQVREADIVQAATQAEVADMTNKKS